MDNEIQGEVNEQPSPRKRPRILRFIKRLIIFLFVSVFCLFTVAVVIGYYYQDEVKELVVGELNKQLNTQVIIDGKDIDFTVIKNFPYASVDFRNLKALDATEKKKKDTLFSAGRISFQFNLMDVFNKKYDIKRIEADHVDLRLRIDKNGNDNYHFWKTNDTVPKSNASFAFALKKLVLKQINVSYKNNQSHQVADVVIVKSTSSGKFSDKSYLMNTVSELFVNEISASKNSYLAKKNVKADVDLMVDNTMGSYKLKDGKIKIEDLLFEITGNVIKTSKQAVVNIGITGKEMDIKSVLSIIPNQFKKRINDYESSGEFYFDAIIEGEVSKSEMPRVKASFGIKNADIKQIKNDIVLHHVTLNGNYFSGNKSTSETSYLELVPFAASIENANFSGELILRNLDAPFIRAKVKGDIPLEKLQQFTKLDTIESINGKMKVDLAFNGDIKELNENNYKNIEASGTMEIENAEVKIKNNPLVLSALNGSFVFDNNDLEINNFSGNVSKSDFVLKGVLKNCMGFALKENGDVLVEASLHSKNINLNELLANKDEDAPKESKYKLRFSEHINVKLNSNIEHIEFRKFEANAIRGIVKLTNKKFSVDSLLFNTLDGKVAISGMIDGSDTSKVLVSCFADIAKVNITKLFIAFENFDQNYITDKNVKGKVNARIQFASIFTPELQIDLDKLYAGVDMSVDNGELNNVESLKKLSKFIELSDLENIRFSALKNQLEIKDRLITIPKMEIKSNAMNFFASGTHNFENEINYKIKLSLNELLAKKIRKPKEKDTEFGEIEDDGLGRTNIFLSMTGTASNPIIKYDAKSAVENVKQDIKVEKQNLKKILKEEFGLFKKDTTLKNGEVKKEDQSKVKIKWEETEVKEESKEKKVLQKPKRKEEEDF